MDFTYKLKVTEFCILILLIVFGGFICFGQLEIDTKKADSKQNLVELSLIVTDKENNFVGDIKKEEISLFLDGKEKSIDSIEQKTSPAIYMMAIDNSGSLRFLLNDILSSAKSIIRQNEEKDFTALMRFVSKDKIQITEKFSSDEKYLHSQLDLFRVEGGQTALIDAIYKSVQIVARQKDVREDYRRIVVVISDGEDRESDNTKAQLIDLLKKEKIQIFFIGLINELPNNSEILGKNPRVAAKKFIERITEESGGAAIFPKKDEQLSEIAKRMASLFHTQYILRFQMPDNFMKDTKVEVKLAKNSKRKNINFHFPKTLAIK